MNNNIVAEIWQKRRAWADAANQFQNETKRYRTIQLLLIIVGSALATAAAIDVLGLDRSSDDTMATGNRIIAGLGAAALAMVGFVQHRFLSLKHSERWPRCRSVAESLKSEIFKFRAGVRPYDRSENTDADAALGLLSDAAAEHELKAKDLFQHVHPNAKTSSDAPAALDPDGYISERLDEQIETFYLPSAQKNLRYANRSRTIVAILAGAGVLISGSMSAGWLNGLGAWVSVLTTMSAAIATFASLNRYDFLASAYAKQAYALSRLRQEWRMGRWRDWSDFVTKCEETISAENRAWMAEMLQERETLEGVLPETEQRPTP